MSGKLIVISGPSGVGKGTVASALEAADPRIKISVSATTRQPRKGDVHGVNYFFLSKDEFEQMIDRDEFLEYAEYVNNCYGTPKKPVLENLEQGISVILEIDVKGAFQVREKYPEAVLIFLTAPMETLVKRIEGRQKMDQAELDKRLATAEWEFLQADKFDHVIENNDLDVTVDMVRKILNVM